MRCRLKNWLPTSYMEAGSCEFQAKLSREVELNVRIKPAASASHHVA